MSYVEDNLMPNEKILFTGKISPAVFIAPGIALVFTIMAFIIAVNLSSGDAITDQVFSSLFLFTSCGFFLGTIYLVIYVIVIMKSTEFAVTTRRTIYKYGFIRRKTSEILLTKIESVGIDQNILGRIANFGEVKITGTGGTSQNVKGMIDPLTIRKKLNQVLEHVHSRMGNQSNS